MKRAVVTVLALVALAAGIVLMAELTQNRPDTVRAGSATTVSFTVSTRDFQRGESGRGGRAVGRLRRHRLGGRVGARRRSMVHGR